MEAKLFSDLVIALLDDENGISEQAYEKLLELGRHLEQHGIRTLGDTIDYLEREVKATDGRFYLPEELPEE